MTKITELPADSGSANIERSDTLVVSRTSSIVRASIGGDLFMPAPVTDNGKIAHVGKRGTPVWQLPSGGFAKLPLKRDVRGLDYGVKHSIDTGFSKLIAFMLELDLPDTTRPGSIFTRMCIYGGTAGDRAAGNTYEFGVAPLGYIEFVITADKTFLVRQGTSLPAETKVLGLWGLRQGV